MYETGFIGGSAQPSYPVADPRARDTLELARKLAQV